MSYNEDYPEVAPSRKPVFVDNTGELGYSPIPPSRPMTSSARQKRICGLTVGVFAVIVGLVVLLIGAAIGGGVGGSLAVKSCNNKLAAMRNSASSTSTSSTPASSVLPVSSGSSSFINYALPVPITSCGESNFSSTYTTESDFTFDKSCAHEFVGSDIDAVVALTWELCMEACGRYNAYKNSTDRTTCVGVTFVPSWVDEAFARSNVSFWSNCFLKYSVPDLNTAKSARSWEVVVSTLHS